jgi:hypothetical protein
MKIRPNTGAASKKATLGRGLRLAWKSKASEIPVFPIPDNGKVDPERLFDALDGRQVTVSGRSWLLQVYGTCEGCGRRWVQLGLTGQTKHMLTLRLAPEDDVTRAVQALSSWLANPSNKAQILSVA